MYTKDDCNRLTEASQLPAESPTPKKEYQTAYDTYEDHKEVNILLSSESSKSEKPAKIKTEWRDSEVG